MGEDALSKAERYRRAADKYGELAEQAEPGYLAEVYRRIAVRYVVMADDILRPERGKGDGLGRDWNSGPPY
jgi:hypothetical protein